MYQPFKNLQVEVLKKNSDCRHDNKFEMQKIRKDSGVDVYEKCSCGFFKKLKTVYGVEI